MDIATTCRGYSDGKAWIQRRHAVELCIFFKTYTGRGYSDGQAWLQRRKSVDIATARRGYSDGVPWNFSKSNRLRYSIPVAIPCRCIHGKLGVVAIATKKLPREKKHLDVAISTLIRGYCHAWQNWSHVLVCIGNWLDVCCILRILELIFLMQ